MNPGGFKTISIRVPSGVYAFRRYKFYFILGISGNFPSSICGLDHSGSRPFMYI